MRLFLVLTLALLMSGCNWIGNVSGLNRDANKAIGAGCRQSGRSLETCYLKNPDADRAQVYAGWKEMNEYMAKNNLQTMAPPPEPPPAAATKAMAEKKKKADQGDAEVDKLMSVINASKDGVVPKPSDEETLVVGGGETQPGSVVKTR